MDAVNGPRQLQRSPQVAIVGMSCRLPGGVRSPQTLWDFLLAGGDGIVPVPPERWEAKAYYDADRARPNRLYVDRGGFIEGIDQFDPQFFGVSPAEATRIDPQQRWLLELTYEALENAGLLASRLRGSDTAVYVGQFMHDYEQLQLDPGARGEINAHTATGLSMTLTANRISYVYDWRGPSIALDTACSSSLVALDLARKGLLAGDFELAVVAGVNILLRPEQTMAICKASMLSPDGRCKSFDASANGYVRSEGCAVVVLQRLADARRDNNRILSIVRASGVNQDGQTKGITVPSGDAQRRLLRSSLSQAGLRGEDIQYAEAHGTGTAVGDPIEVNALGEVLGERALGEPPCVIGSIKSNIGHTEAAAGLAGVIKAVLAMNHGTIPGNIHYETPNPNIDFAALNLQVADACLDWPDSPGRTRRAIVNSFGFGGTNANCVLELPEAGGDEASAPALFGDFSVLPISAKSPQALGQLAARYEDLIRELIANPSAPSLADVAACAAKRRDAHPHRLAVSAATLSQALQALEDFGSNRPSPLAIAGHAAPDLDARLCFVFPGMGTQWLGMGRGLYGAEPRFRASLERCSEALQRFTGWSLIDEMFADAPNSRLDDTDVAQPAIFAMQVALCELLNEKGIRPSALIGHSAGEIAAAYVAGAIDFDSAVRVAFHRSRLQRTTEGLGRMLAVGLSELEAIRLLGEVGADVSIAAVNGPRATTLAGAADTLERLAARLESDGVFARFLRVGVPYHSPVMDRLRVPLIEALADIRAAAPHLRLYSTVSGRISEPGDWNAEYWARNVREPVRFKAAVEACAADGVHFFVEVGPHGALGTSIRDTLAAVASSGVVVETLQRNQPEMESLARSVARLFSAGWGANWSELYPAQRSVVLPNYPWQHASYWSEPDEVRRGRLQNLSPGTTLLEARHPLLGGRVNSGAAIWQRALEFRETPYLGDHRVEQDVVYPAAGYLEMMLALAAEMKGRGPFALRNATFTRALFVDESAQTLLETALVDEGRAVEVRSFERSARSWGSHARAELDDSPPPAPPMIDLKALEELCPNRTEAEQFYRHCDALGLNYGAAFRTVRWARQGERDVLVELKRPSAASTQTTSEYCVYPPELDGAFQALFPLVERGYLPTQIGSLRYWGPVPEPAFCHLRLRHRAADHVVVDLVISDDAGRVVLEVQRMVARALDARSVGDDTAKLLFEYQWRALPPAALAASDAPRRPWLVFADRDGFGQNVARELARRGHSVTLELVPSAASADARNKIADCGPDAVARFESLLAEVDAQGCAILCTWALDYDVSPEASTADVLYAAQRPTLLATELAQALLRRDSAGPIALHFVSRNAHRVDGSEPAPSPAQASLWGFARVLSREYPNYRVGLIDLPTETGDALVAEFVDHLLSECEEPEVALRAGGRYAHCLGALDEQTLSARSDEPTVRAHGPFQLTRKYASNGRDGLTLRPASVVATPGDLFCEIECVGLLRADWEALFSDASLLGERLAARRYPCIAKVVSDAEHGDFVAGERVIGFAGPGVASSASVWGAVRRPPMYTDAQALSLPSAFVPAQLAFSRVARLQRGDSVLILEAGHGVGLAALELARLAGARVFACASSEHEHSRLAARGVEVAYGPNAPGFVDSILAATAGSGVDVLVNTLSPRVLRRVVPLCRALGSVIQFGDEPLAADSQLLELFHQRGLSHQTIDFGRVASERPELLRDLLLETIEVVDQRALECFEPPAFACDEAEKALAHVRAESSCALVCLNFQGREPLLAPEPSRPVVRSDATYLVTGGLGGLGLEVLRWLVDLGARSIVLTGRSEPSPSALVAIQQSRDVGATVMPMRADMTREEDVARVLKTIAATLPPLAGVFHAAGVLDDGVIAQQSEQRLERVMAPKVSGAWNLHRQTLGEALDFFVLFSSIASVVGWAGQSNYAAGNAFLDSLAHHRRARGLPALSINWGPWSESGMAASLASQDQKRMRNAGMALLSPARALAGMKRLMSASVTQASVIDVDWERLVASSPNLALNSVFLGLITDASGERTSNENLQELASAAPERRAHIVERTVRTQLAAVLGLEDGSGLSPQMNLFDYGVNSLMSMDLLARLQAKFAIKLPSTLILKHPTLAAISERIVDCLTSSPAPTQDELYWDSGFDRVPSRLQRNGRLACLPPAILHWIYERHTAHFNVGALLEIDADDFDLGALQTTLNILFTYPDGLRVRTVQENGEWVQEVAPLDGDVAIETHDLRELGAELGLSRMTELNDALHRSLRFDRESPLYRIAHYQLDPGRSHFVAIIIHHYISDGWSQKLMAEALTSLYERVRAEKPVRLPSKSYTLFEYRQRIQDFAANEAIAQLPYWIALEQRARTGWIRDDFEARRARGIDAYAVREVTLSASDYQALEAFCRAKNLEFSDLGAYCLTRAFGDVTGAPRLWVDLMSHARSDVFEGVTVLDIVGQISENNSVLYELSPNLGHLAQIQSMREQRQRAPNSGIGYWALRLMNGSPLGQLGAAAREPVEQAFGPASGPQVGLNFDLTDYAREAAQKSWYRLAKDGFGTPRGQFLRRPAAELSLSFYVCFRVHDGILSLTIDYYRDRFHDTTVAGIAQRTLSYMLEVAASEATESFALLPTPPERSVSVAPRRPVTPEHREYSRFDQSGETI